VGEPHESSGLPVFDLGNYGLEMTRGCQRATLDVILDLGAGGAKIGGIFATKRLSKPV
jgi:hypothetical protein